MFLMKSTIMLSTPSSVTVSGVRKLGPETEPEDFIWIIRQNTS